MKLTSDEEWRIHNARKVIGEDQRRVKIHQSELKQLEDKRALNNCPGCDHARHGEVSCPHMVSKSDDSYDYWTEPCGCEYKEVAA